MERSPGFFPRYVSQENCYVAPLANDLFAKVYFPCENGHGCKSIHGFFCVEMEENSEKEQASISNDPDVCGADRHFLSDFLINLIGAVRSGDSHV